MIRTPTASYSITVRARIDNKPGVFARVATCIGEKGGLLGAIDLVEATRDSLVRDITIAAADDRHAADIVAGLKKVSGVHVVRVSDRTFLMHIGGKIEIAARHPVNNRDDLSMVYTPGVARICEAIHEDPAMAFHLTIKRNTVAVVTDGSAVLGLGNLGPAAALPVMEGKAVLFKAFGGVDAFPICLDTQDTDEIVRTVKHLAPVFGGINLEDIAAPRCFEVELRLREELDIPVFHDDQHGTAVVLLAGLLNAVKVVQKPLDSLKVVISGAGAAGTAIADILLEVGVTDIVVVDRTGAIHRERKEGMTGAKHALAARTNPRGASGSLARVMKGADVFIGVSQPDVLTLDDVKSMADDAIVFAMANPEPEIAPELAVEHVAVMATGRSDYPNQINNVLCFPGLFRGVLDCHAREINMAMKIAAARAIANVVSERELSADYVIPSVFNKRVGEAVAKAVAKAAMETKVARRDVLSRRWGD